MGKKRNIQKEYKNKEKFTICKKIKRKDVNN